MKLTQNTILITGGASGIGFELARQLSQLGNTVIITGRDQKKLAHAKQQLPQIKIVQSDVSDIHAVQFLFEQLTKEFPELNILINNAGIMREINLHNQSESPASITQEIETNLKGPIHM